MCPIKARAGIDFSSWGNVFMSCDVPDVVPQRNGGTQIGQGLVLRCLKPFALKAFQFDANRIIVAVIPSPVA